LFKESDYNIMGKRWEILQYKKKEG
jgi:hypothetical protein